MSSVPPPQANTNQTSSSYPQPKKEVVNGHPVSSTMIEIESSSNESSNCVTPPAVTPAVGLTFATPGMSTAISATVPITTKTAAKPTGADTSDTALQAHEEFKKLTSDKDNRNDVSTEEELTTDEDEKHIQPWLDSSDWVPTTRTGRQKTPKEIRSALQTYLNTSGRSQKSVMSEIGVGQGSFRKFMFGSYKNQWSAVQNETYWAAAQFLEKMKDADKENKAVIAKRKASTSDNTASTSGSATKKTKTKAVSSSRAEGDQLLKDFMATPGVAQDDPVFDKCPQVVKKLQEFFQDHPDVTKASFRRIALLGSASNALSKFMASKHADQQGNAVYRRAYTFFEKLRLMKRQPKTPARLENEQKIGPLGFSTKPFRKVDHVYLVPSECPHEAGRNLRALNYRLSRQEQRLDN